MAKTEYPKSQLPIRKTSEFLPKVFQTDTNDKFLSGVFDPLVQPGTLEKVVGFVGKRYGKTFNGKDIYLDTDNTLRSRYQLEPGVVTKENGQTTNFYDYIDFKNILRFFGNTEERDDIVDRQEHYSWNPPIDWDKFINFREYYWVPSGPPSIHVYGLNSEVTSTYRVKTTQLSTFIFYPDGYTNNPTITLYRGQKYKFIIDAVSDGFVIKTSYDTGSLTFRPNLYYPAGSLVVFNGSLWKAKVNVNPQDGSTIDANSQDWEFVSLASKTSSLDYNTGVTNNGTEKGTVTFDIPYDAPDVLYYQSVTDPNKFGRFLIGNVESNTKIDIEKDIIGKATYSSGNGIQFTNGMVVSFGGTVLPTNYATGNWLVEGVGSGITLTLFDSLVIPILSTTVPEVLFDNEGFDTAPFDDASAYPTSQDYITIGKSSIDANPWSRYNRWFHRSVLEYAHNLSGSNFESPETARAKRPIIEFLPNLKLYQHGSVAKTTVDYIDTYTTDVFSNIEGSSGYSVDGETLFDGARLLVTADTDSLANNRIYEVKFITYNNVKQITLKTVSDTESIIDETVLIRRGKSNQGSMYFFDGTTWMLSQAKTKVNQAPLFDVFDDNEVSLSNTESYPVTTFTGTQIVGYTVNSSGVNDSFLGFPISHLNIDNVGDILFTNFWDSDQLSYEIDKSSYQKKISTGFYKFNNSGEYANGWVKTDSTYLQPIIDSQIITTATDIVTFTTVDWDLFESDPTAEIYFYLNGVKLNRTYVRDRGIFTFSSLFNVNDALSIKVFCNSSPDTGYYELPCGLERNPLNETLNSFTFGQATDHISSAVEFNSELNGKLLGSNNLRDIQGYQYHAKRFLKHANIAPVTSVLLIDKKINLVKAIRYAKKSYTEFKNNFLATVENLNYDQDVPNFIDKVIADLTKAKTNTSPFVDSDMIGSGAFNSLKYTVEDTGIKTFFLSENFDLLTLSRQAVYVYHNNVQLVHGRDYEFNSTFSFVTLLIDLSESDTIEIREYTSTAFSHIPPTPTKLGLYKKYLPRKFLDDTFVTPKEMIQGHDGSLITAFGDYRDDIILELELRIYNNIKISYREELFDNDTTLGGYYNTGIFDKSQLDKIIIPEFLNWISNTTVDYIQNSYFDSQNSFTYTYNQMTDPANASSLPGYWRGVYQWFYDTVRPHTCPWEMLGFSEKPTWWESEYGPAPYTRNNLLLWEDLANGIIKQGVRKGIHNRYKRPSLLSHIPTDDEGRLLSPLDSNLAQNFALINNNGPFELGSGSPAEYAWSSGSEYPFAIVIALSLLQPFEFIGQSFDRSKITTNKLGQTINTLSRTFVTVSDFATSEVGGALASGLSQYVVDYLRNENLPITDLEDRLSQIDVALSYRMSGFVDQTQQKFILDSKNPKSTSSNIFVPNENQEIFFNVSAPITDITYSGIIVEKLAEGWKVSGYDNLHPYFYYYPPVPTQASGVISVGGVSEEFLIWATNQFYGNGVIVRYQNIYYRSLKSHTSADVFDPTFWKKLADLPKKNSVDAYRRNTFDYLNVATMTYGTVLPTVQDVVDLFLGYEQYLISKGFIFDNYDSANKINQDWTTSAREFMYWTSHNWSEGSLLTLSPSAQKLNVSFGVGVPDNLLDSFYDYQVYRSDGNPLAPNFINVKRDFQSLTVETTNTTDGIYFFKAFLVLKEHVAIFSDRTVFNDVIYDKPTGYRQERIKARGFRTVDWDGDYTSPGFLFDNVNISVWQPFVDYRLGDIVAYRSHNWVSQVNQQGQETFNDTKWSILDSTPTRSLVPNFDYKINQFDDYYALDGDGLESSQKDLGRHAIGYQTRDYLQNLSEDDVTQFQLYQGFIRDKGTLNAASKIFDKLSKTTTDAIVLNEEWAFKVGTFGGQDQLSEIEFQIDKSGFQINPQPILFVSSIPNTSILDQYLRIPASSFTKAPSPFTINLLPKTDAELLQTSGYVSLNHVDYAVATKDDILNIDIAGTKEGDNFWITFDGNDWTVDRLAKQNLLNIISAVKKDATVEITFNMRHGFAVGDIIGITNIPNLTGFFKITSVTYTTAVVGVSKSAKNPTLDNSTILQVYSFISARIPTDAIGTASVITPSEAALLPQKSKLWIDMDSKTDGWKVVQKNQVFNYKGIIDYGTTVPLNAGTTAVYVESSQQTITSMPANGLVVAYVEGTTGLQVKELISPDIDLINLLSGSFGSALAVSPDGQFLIIGSPKASGIVSGYVGYYNNRTAYYVNDIVLYAGKLWRALANIRGDGSTITIASGDWEVVTLMTWDPYEGRDSGFRNQGMVHIYKWKNSQWTLSSAIVSPRPAFDELFGTNVSIGKDGTNYWMAVTAPGALDNRGRVYLYKFDGSVWTQNENTNYFGIYDISTTFYPQGTIVWFNDALWQATADIFNDGSSLNYDLWQQVDDISTQNSLPTNVALLDDGSTVTAGLLSPTDLAELTKQGDGYGYSISMNKTGSVLVVGAPYSDGQYFANYRGLWTNYQEYTEGDVVKYQTTYYRLSDNVVESTIKSIDQLPTAGVPWTALEIESNTKSGKIYIYQRDANDVYKLKQTITAGNLADINDTGSSVVSKFGDNLGYSVSVDATGTDIVASSPSASVDLQTQGSVFYFNASSLSTPTWRLKQQLQSFEKYNNLLFGSSVSISSGSERIAIGAKNAPYKKYTTFEVGAIFDKDATIFSDFQGYAGQVYSFERLNGQYLLTEKLYVDNLKASESFGATVFATSNTITVGSPQYAVNDIPVGMVRTFRKDPTTDSLTTIAQQEQLIDISKIRNISLIDNVKNVKIQDVDLVDYAKLKILGIAEEEIKFKTPYDPAVYTIGTDSQVVDSDAAWFSKQKGQLWWNISTAKWVNYEQGDLTYKFGNWNRLAVGASIDVYEWVETPLLPNEWSALADTANGLSNGISGQPLYPNNDVYSVKKLFNPVTQQQTQTLYYYWVKSSTVLPTGVIGRKLSAGAVAALIRNPASTGNPVLAVVDSDKLLAYNFPGSLSSGTALLNIELYKDEILTNPIHREYMLLSEGVASSVPNDMLEQKWIDSIIGFDQAGNTVPDPKLPVKERYGISIRPRQSMFVDKTKISKIVIDRVNSILATRPYADTLNFNNLNLADEIPVEGLNEYDLAVDTLVDLAQIGTLRVSMAVLQTNIINGEIDTIDIIDPGFGYKRAPFVTIEGGGVGATASVTIDNQGRVNSVTVITRGKKYESALVKIRSYSILVRTDSSINNFWAIYSWDQDRLTFYRSKSQGYDTTKYWSYVDWWAEGYSIKSRIIHQLDALYLEPTLITSPGDLLKIKEYGNGGWAILNRVVDGTGDILGNYVLVGRNNGTIAFNDSLYNKLDTAIGYDNIGYYDTALYDLEPSKEFRNIFKAIKEDICIDDIAVEWNNLFFASVAYAFSEQTTIDWAFKTSFVNATHNVGTLEQKLNYKNDNLPAFQKYLEEIKPYRTTIREYTSRYDFVEPSNTNAIDFDLPPVYSTRDAKIVPVGQGYNLFDQYPWKFWADNYGFSIVAIDVASSGSEYTTPPSVIIEGNGKGATAKAYISNGKVSGIQVLTSGSGYTTTPTVRLVGGNGSSTDIAKVVAILGESKVRVFNLSLRFDRITKDGLYKNFAHEQTFTALGNTAVFNLAYAPTRDKSKVKIYKNGQLVLNNEYELQFFNSTVDTYQLLKGKLVFLVSPLVGDTIKITYEKNDLLLDSVNRIQKYYAPTSGMIGNDVGQLMTGIDFGGVQIQGTTFDVTGGWDALPWFTDGWDSVEANSDYYVVVDGSTTEIALPFVPAEGQLISIYIKRSGTQNTIRLDSVTHTIDGSGEMPTFIGDGSTNVIGLSDYIHTHAGDTLIFRPFESDGSVSITDPNLLDTKVSGGSFASLHGAYSTATGKTAEEITIDGSKFISPEQVPAPEENVPGQVLDSLSIKVFQTTETGASPIHSSVIISNGVKTHYPIGLTITEKNSILVYVNKVRYAEAVDYQIDFVSNEIILTTAPATGSLIELIAIGRGGSALLDYQEFVADGSTSLFLTQAEYTATQSVFVTVDGVEVDTGFSNSTIVAADIGADILPEKAIVQFAIKPELNQVIKIIALGVSAANSGALSVIRVNNQTLIYDGSTRSFVVDKFVDLSRSSAISSTIVMLNNRKLKGPDSYYRVYDGTNNTIPVGKDPKSNVTSVDIKVYVNNILQPFVTAYVYDGTIGSIIVNPIVLNLQDVIKIEISNTAEYTIVDSTIAIPTTVTLNENDVIEVTWFSEYPTFDIVSDTYSGGKVQYQLARHPLDASYVWVYKNGERLARGTEFYTSFPRNVVYLNVETTTADIIEIVQFGNNIYKDPRSFEIHKDMLNITHYKRYSLTNTKLAKSLNYYDQEIYVTDSSTLDEPVTSRNIPGIVVINNEKIEYMKKEGNVLSQLRRGSLGTAIKELHAVGSKVVNSGTTDTIPYADKQERSDFVSDGSTLLIGQLEFVPVKSDRVLTTRTTIPAEYGICDQVEVFVAGARLRKDPITVYDETLGASSPSADTVLEPEFTVNGVDATIRLTKAVPAGTRILVIRKSGKIWYERADTTASKGVTLLDNNTPIAKFIDQKASELPE